jgi:hypothetical protein
MGGVPAGGYCMAYCPCPTGSHCYGGFICVAECTTVADCRPGYTCADSDGDSTLECMW